MLPTLRSSNQSYHWAVASPSLDARYTRGELNFMAQSAKSTPTHLGVFALQQGTGLPITRMPVYAEVGVTIIEEVPYLIDSRFEELIYGVLSQQEPACAANHDCRSRVTNAVANVLSRTLTQAARDALVQDPTRARGFLDRIFVRARDANASAPLGDADEDTLDRLLESAVRDEAREQQVGLNQPPPRTRWTHPLGVLGTDHAGYLSFDLTRLPAPIYQAVVDAITARRKNLHAALDASVLVYPMAREELRFEALAQGRFAPDAIVLKIEMPSPELPPIQRNLGLLAMQNPGLTDWRLSPGSFAGNPGTLVGQDGCETLLPANVALQEFHGFQVVRLAERSIQANLPAGVKLGLIHDYRMRWFPLGHSLGQILYSLPLAPGESVNLAVIDWTRRDDAQRQERTKLDEQIVHNEHRERTISEAVNAAIKETQKGSSFMAGLAESSGIAGTIGKFGVASGLAGALGGGSSSTAGARDLAATTVQSLSDNISQASAAMRELQSTVVVHAVQEEHEAIETRTIVNYNHSHALTILYYEVLRHFRILTELFTRKAAVLVKMRQDWFDDPNGETNILEYRAPLEAVLLNATLADGFNAIARIAHRKKVVVPPPPSLPLPGDRELSLFRFEMATSGLVANLEEQGQSVGIFARLLNDPQPRIVLKNRAGPGATESDSLAPAGAFSQENAGNTFLAVLPAGLNSVKWKDFTAVSIGINLNNVDDVSFTRIKMTAISVDGGEIPLVDQNYAGGDLVIAKTSTEIILAKLPSPPPPPPAPPRPPEEIEDEAKRGDLIEHLRFHKAHYSRAILLAQNTADRATALDAIVLPDGTTLLDQVENRPLEVIGEYLAYPCANPDWTKRVDDARRRLEVPDVPPDERLVTLPTRGVFAEAKLGHCNASEEIDNTRFWDWQQSPIPHFAPEIAPVTAVTPQPQAPNLAPTPFPQSLVNIVTPPNAPDPTGLAAALTAISTPNIFRDMSGRAEVADLLKKLSDNSISIAQAAQQARGILSKEGAASIGGGGGGGAAGGGGSGARAGGGAAPGSSAGGAMPPNEQHDRMQVVRNAVQKGELTPEEGRREVKKIVGAPQEQRNAPQVILTGNSAALRAFFPPDDNTGQIILEASASNVPMDSTIGWDETLGGHIELKVSPDLEGTRAEATALVPGRTTVRVVVLDGAGTELASSSMELSVPQFVEISGDSAELDAVFSLWHLAGHKDDMLARARAVAKEILSDGNARLVWSVQPLGEAPPAQFAPGGKADGNLSRVTLGNTSATGQLYDVEFEPAANVSGRGVRFNLGLFTTSFLAGPFIQTIVDKLGTLAVPDPGLEDFAAELTARHLGRIIAGLVRDQMVGVSPGQPVTFGNLTGFEAKEGGDVADPATYKDLGIGAMHFKAATKDRFNRKFPVPPAFS